MFNYAVSIFCKNTDLAISFAYLIYFFVYPFVFLRACLNFARVRFESFLRGYFSVFMRMIAGYLTSENGKIGRKKAQK